ncbi:MULTISPECIES: substrate-binding domain-containing protein [unclassified Caballeronia]|jgi:ribose transport system substrate-binding protein|uniref:substrate-binding domain-containing protein n=1 Tax=unclassified Caballeronia TaxID=2646786 RepID=UPI003ECDA39B
MKRLLNFIGRRCATTLMIATIGVSAIESPQAFADGTGAAGKHIAYLAPSFDIPFWRTVSKAVTETAKNDGGTVTSYDSHNDAATQLKNVQDAIAQGVAGIVLSPTDSSTAPSVLAVAARAKVPVVIADIGTNSGEYVSFVVSDNETGAYETGKKLAQELKAKGWEKGGYGICTISLARQIGQWRTEGFRRAMREAGVKEVALNQMQRYTTDETFRFVQDMMTAHPDMHAVFVEIDQPVLGAARAIHVAHRENDVALAGFDGLPEFVDMLENGSLVVAGMQQPYMMGQKSVEALVDHWAGKASPKKIVLPMTIVTKDNVQQLLPTLQKMTFPSAN